MRARSITISAVGVLVAVALTACSDDSPDSSNAPKAGETRSAAPTATQPSSSVPSTSASDKVPSGLVLGTCLTADDEIEFVDPVTGHVSETRHFALESGKYHTYGLCGNLNGSGYELRSAYDSTFSNLAVHAVMEDDAYHVGVIPASESTQEDTTSRFKDLSGVTEDGFSAATQQSPGTFGPDGKLYFVQKLTSENETTFKLMTVNPEGGQPQEVDNPTEGIEWISVTGDPSSDWALYFPPGSTQPRLDPDIAVVYSPDGSWAILQEPTVGHLFYGPPDSQPTKIEVNVGEPAPTPFRYVSNTSYYGMSGDDELVLATIQGGAVTSKSLLPSTDGDISEPTLSPDGQTIAFMLEKDNSRALYTVPSAGGQPTKVKDLERDTFILDWIA